MRGRREFLIGTGLVGTSLLVGVRLSTAAEAATSLSPTPQSFSPNAFIRIARDNTITVVIGKAEMGQGVYTSLAMLVAEELEVDPNKLKVEFGAVGPAFFNSPKSPVQFTAGSTSIRSNFEPMRKAGATARLMLVAAAARKWKVDPSQLTAANAVVTDGKRKATYGELVEVAATLEAPQDVPLKDAKDFKVIGKSIRRLDGPPKVSGQAIFGIDVRRPDMLIAMVARAPVFGAKVASLDDKAARAVSGVVDVKQVPSGVAVLATNTWAARTGRDALQVQWTEGAVQSVTVGGLREDYRKLAATPGLVMKNAGDADKALAASSKVLEAEYDVPFLAHACMEPMNCVAHVVGDQCEIWASTQYQSEDRKRAAAVLGFKPEQVALHTTFLGGGFGRRSNPESDYIVEAVQLARLVDKPVKVIWTREDDMRGGWYRPYFLHSLRGGLDDKGMPVAWRHTLVGQSVATSAGFRPPGAKGPDNTSVEGAADFPYALANHYVDFHETKNGVPIQFWRSVAHSHNGFVVNSFLDELAVAGKQDPLELRRKLLADKPRELAVLNLAAEKAGWSTPVPEGRARGIAFEAGFGSLVAQVAEVSLTADGVKVHRVVTAVDCGPVVDPNNVVAQIESAIVYGMSAALWGEITFEKGQVQQGNFTDYRILRIEETPRMETYIVNSTGPVGGIGELGLPCVAPAITNAMFRLNGKRIRRLPIASSLSA